MRQELNLFGLGIQGKSPNVTANQLQNCYYEFQPEKDKTTVAIYGSPGLELFIDKGDTPWRGLLPFPGNSKLYGVHRGTFYEINNAGVITSRGTIGTTSGRVDICDNGTEIAVVDGQEIYVYNTSTPATPIAAVADVDRPTSPNTCCFQGGRILTDEDGTGQFKGSDTYAATSWQALNFATAESNPDPVIRVINYRGNVPLFGSYSTETWSNVGGSGFPYAKVTGADMEYGLASRWSVAKFMGSYAFLAQNREGQVFVARLDGYNASRISNFELDYIINSYSTKSDATGFGYMLGGHPMYQLNFPTQGVSWLFDGSTNYWSKLTYNGTGRHRAEFGVDFLNQTIVADYSNGKLYRLKQDVYTDNGVAIQRQLTGRHIFSDNKMLKLERLEINGEIGSGLVSGQGSDPQMVLQLSKDSGHTFGTEMYSTWGKVGEYTARCKFYPLGSGRDVVPRLTYSEPTKFVLTTAVLWYEGGN